MNDAEMLAKMAEMEAQLAGLNAEIAKAAAKPVVVKAKTFTTRGMRRQAKAKALVDWFICEDMEEAYAYLADMGE